MGMMTMPKGGARNRSGPQKDPNSLKSEQIGFVLTALPSEGYRGEVPTLGDYLLEVTERHEQIWNDLWSTPQACAWSLERWRWPVVADLVMLRVRSDDPESPVGLATSIRQLRDDLGLSKAGLIANGWAIAPNEVAAKAAVRKKPAQQTSARDRMKVVKGGDGA